LKISILSAYGPSLINLRGALISAIARAGHEVIACAPESDQKLDEQVAALGARYQCIPLERTGMNPITDFKSVARLVRFFQNQKIDLSFAYSIKPVLLASFAARLASVPAASLIPGLGHLFMPDGPRDRILLMIGKVLYRQALRRNQVVFFQNPDDEACFRDLGLVRGEQNQIVNGSGVDLDEFHQMPLPDGPPTFLLVARLIRAKGIAEFIEAARRVKSKWPACRFILSGRYETGPHRIGPEDLNAWLSNSPVEYVGEASDVRTVLKSASVFVLPSWYREGIPRSLLEAMAAGRPLITTDSVGCRETVEHGKNGFLVPPRNALALAEAMERFAAGPELIPAFGMHSRRIALEKFDVKSVNQTILQRLNLIPRMPCSRTQNPQDFANFSSFSKT
jgi:glycosyltransferase involved in cell wall biosynthesis